LGINPVDAGDILLDHPDAGAVLYRITRLFPYVYAKLLLISLISFIFHA
jgi:hypothetical protein